MNSVLSPELTLHRAETQELVRELHQLTLDIGHQGLAQTLSELRTRMEEPFMFVIVGEVKAGKSSFINALLDTGRDICKVAPDPCTDTIQQIVYGEIEQQQVLGEFLTRIYLPEAILREIAIVDTPGTNTIIAHHQEITERFIPASDLIVFVFEAKNPYRQSAWEFFDYIHSEWRRKVIFVLQQADLLPPEDLAINLQGVLKYAEKKGITQPQIFAVSALLEQKGEKAASGYAPLREYIRSNITGGQAPLLKLKNNLDTALNISSRIHEGLGLRAAQLKADQRFREEIRQNLSEQQNRSYRQRDMLVENLMAEYDRATRQGYDALESELGFFAVAKRAILSVFGSKPDLQKQLAAISESLEKNLANSFDQKLRAGVLGLAESIQQTARMVDLKLRGSESILRNNHDIFGAIAEQRANVLRDLQEAFQGFMDRTENFVGAEQFQQDPNFTPNMAAGSGIAVVGVVLAAVTQGAVFDITGGLLTALGLLFAGATVSVKRGQLLKGYEEAVGAGRIRLEQHISGKITAYLDGLQRSIESHFEDFDAMMANEEQALQQLVARHEALGARLKSLSESLG